MDLEMTGLDPARHVIGEIATLITDDDLAVVAPALAGAPAKVGAARARRHPRIHRGARRLPVDRLREPPGLLMADRQPMAPPA
jgi:hypothetical protein